MPGFYISNMLNTELRNTFDDRCVCESFYSEGFFCSRNTLDRFMDDKVFADLDDVICIMEGVILNKKELLESEGYDSLQALVRHLYDSRGEVFYDCFRGSFSGALYDKKKRKWIIFTNHYGDNAVFYYFHEGQFAFASQVNYILDALHESHLSIAIDVQAVYKLLTYAFMTDDSTPCDEVKRLLPGHYAVIENGEMTIKQYYAPKGRLDLSDLKDDELVEELDLRFRNAVKREFEKDDEYGFQHLVDLSGGLDSRMTTWVAHDLGFENCLNVTYCQAGYLDERVASQIASDLGNKFMFKSLNDASFIYDAKQMISMNFGLGLYMGMTGGNQLLGDLNISKYGLEHTGQIGDVVIGTFIEDAGDNTRIDHSGFYSDKLIGRLDAVKPGPYIDREDYLIRTRAFLGACASHFIRQNYTEVASPFLDVDVMDFCFSVPVEKRIGHSLYKRWILERYPKAGDYVWEKQGVPLTASRLGVDAVKAKRKARRCAQKVIPNLVANDSWGMNPTDYWYSHNKRLKEYMDSTFLEYQACFETLGGGVLEDAKNMYRSGTALEKLQVLSAEQSVAWYLGFNVE